MPTRYEELKAEQIVELKLLKSDYQTVGKFFQKVAKTISDKNDIDF